MNDVTFSPEYTSPPEKKSKLGCILGGCLGVILFGCVGLGLVGFAGYRYVTGQVEKFTSDTPQELPTVVYSDEEMEQLQARIENIGSANPENVESSRQVVLTSDDINALLSQDDELKGNVYVTIADGDVTAEVSVPVDMIPGGKGRFLNGSITAHVSLDDGFLLVRAADITVNGEKLPEEFVEAMKQENLAKSLNTNPDTRKRLREFESIEIVDDKVIITLVDPTEGTADEATTVDGADNEATDVGETANEGASAEEASEEGEEPAEPQGELETTSP
ncbi:MAG: hypothetical protein AAF497_06110 [Planctomycetota bacterium]